MAHVRFVIGRAGTGKTTHCFRAIVEALRAQPLGPLIYWILPKQATFAAERDLTCASGLNGFCRVRIVSFESLGDEVLSECGGCAIPRVNAIGRQMLIGHLLRTTQDELKFFSGVARQPGLASRLDATFGEFERSGQETTALQSVIDELEHPATGDPHLAALRDKLSDVHTLYSEYRAVIGQERLDPQARMTTMLSCINRCESLRGASIYVDSFHEFTGNERQILTALAQVAKHLDVTLTLDPTSPVLKDGHTLPHELSLFHQTEQTYRRLWLAFQQAGVSIAAPLRLETPHRFARPALRAVEASLFDFRHKSSKESTGVTMIAAADRRAEVDAVARQIRRLITSGQRLRDIAVLVRELDDYHELIDASFREHHLPWFVDRRRTAGHHPLIQFIRAVLAIARQNWPHDAAMSLIKCGLVNLQAGDADALENYVLQHRITGAGWTDVEPWAYERRGYRDDDETDDDHASRRTAPSAMDVLRRELVERIEPFVALQRWRQPTTVRQTVADLYALFESFDIPRTISRWMEEATLAGDFEQRDEHAQVWEELIDLFDQMTDLLGEATLSLDEFAEVLETGLEQFDLAIAPATVDQVLVGQVNRTRTSPGLRTVIVMGLGEGQFPRASREDSILADEERRTLLTSHHSLEIDPGSERRLLDENFLGYLAFTRAGSQLIVTRPISSEDGRALAPSPFWQRLQRLLPQIEPIIIERDSERAWEHIGTPRQLVTSLMNWVRDQSPPSAGIPGEGRGEGQTTSNGLAPPGGSGAAGPSPLPGIGGEEASDDPRPALYEWLASYECCDDSIDIMRRRAWRALSYENSATLSPDISTKLFASPLESSVTRFESFATCPFQHFARFGLRLEERESQDVTLMDLGNVYHQILERIVRELLKSRSDWRDLDATQSAAMVRRYAQEIGQTLRGELMLSTARNKYLLARIEQTLERVIATQQAVFRRGHFRPAAAEVTFGVDAQDSLPPLEIATPKGNMVRLRGKIDRVDVLADTADFAVIDYKLGDRALSMARVYHGVSLQLLTYLLVLQAHGKQLHGKPMTPTAAFYVKLLRNLDKVRHPDDAIGPDDPLFHLQTKPRGLFEARVLSDLDEELESGRSDVVQVYLKQDGSFGHLDSSDVASDKAFAALLEHVRRRIGELADQIIGGAIEVKPYRIGKVTPCPTCAYRSVCRFEPGVNRYYHLSGLKRSEVLDIVENTGASDGA